MTKPHIRPVHPDDAPSLHEIATHPQVARRLLQLPSKELGQTEMLLQEQIPGLHRLVAVANQRLAGFASLKQPQNPRLVHSATLGMMVHPDYWRQGIGTALMAAILDLADNWLNLRRVDLSVQEDNTAAVHLYEKFGFEREGLKKAADFAGGRYQGQLIMARLHGGLPALQPADVPRYPPRKDVASVAVRPVRVDDAHDLHELFTHPGVGFGTNQLPSREIARTLAWLGEQHPGIYRYAAAAQHADGSTKVIGNLTLHQHPKPRQMHGGWFGMSVHPNYWGHGIGTKLLVTALDLADNWLGLKRVELEVHTDNPGAIHLYEKFGFELEGTKRLYSYGAGRWADAHFMARLAPGFPDYEDTYGL